MQGLGGHTRIRVTGVAILIALAVLLGLTGCTSPDPAHGSGALGTGGQTGALKLRNVLAVSGGEGAATLIGTILNEGDADDSLVGLTISKGTTRLGAQTTPIPGNTAATLGVPTLLDDDPTSATLRGPQVIPGRMVEVTFEFERAQSISLWVMVFDREGALRDIPVPNR